jgi:hypothetical protein
VKGGMNPVAW